ncbi:MAG: hypothetical protein IJ089_04510 [Clostridia bacterium]|nr:hypothetical protein [Clostridia bacterium]
MSVLNTASTVDVRKVMSGKDGALYSEDGTMIMSAENFQSQVAITNASYQPLGDAQEHGAMTSYKVTLNFNEIIIEDSKFFQEFMDGLKNHRMPAWTFRGTMRSPYDDDNYEDIVYRDCVPDGTIDIQNMQVGELYKRPWSFIVNRPPELQSLLTNAL